MSKQKLSRRDFLRLMGMSAAATAAGGHLLQHPFGAYAGPLRQDVTEISFMGWGDVEEDEGVQVAIEAFEAEQDAIKIKWLHTPDNYNEKLLSNVAAGTPPDTAFISYSVFRTYVHDGLIMDVTELMENDELLSTENYFVEPQETNRTTVDGKWYGIGSTWTANHMYFNLDLLEAAGVEPPDFDEDKIWDWDTFLDAARKLTIDENGLHPDEEGFDLENVVQWGFYMGVDWWMAYDQLAQFNGGAMSDGKIITLDSEEALAGIQAIADLVHVHHVMPEAVFFNELGMDATQMLDTGRLAMVIDGSWALSFMYKMDSPLGVGPVPRMSENGTAAGQGHVHAILNGSENVEASWEWLRFLAGPFYQRHFCNLGLWVPNQTAMLTEEGIDEWVNEEIHPDNYRKFVSEYIPNHMKPTLVPAGYPRAQAFFLPALERVMNNEGTAAELIPPAVAEANEVLLEEYGD